MNPLVSVVIPCYNAESVIAETISSVMNQTYTNWEIIIVNDGSTDQSMKVISGFDHPSIQVLDQQNIGVSRARNNGAKHAKGEFIMFLDADDILSNSFIEKRVEIFNNNLHVNIIGSIVKVFSNTITDVRKTQRSIVDDFKRDVLLYLDGSTTTPSSYFFRMELFKGSEEIYNPFLSSTADRYFLLHYGDDLNGLICEDETACLYYRVSANSMSSRITIKLVEDNERFYDQLIKNGLISQGDSIYLKKGYFILYRSNLKIMRPIRAAFFFWKWLFS